MKFCKGVKYWENLLELLVYQTLKKVFMISYAISIHDRQTDRQTNRFSISIPVQYCCADVRQRTK